MLIYFKDKRSLSFRAVQIWQVLTGMAHTRRTTTYKELAGILGYKGAGVLGRQLGHIMFFCHQNELPPLTVLVVNSDTGLPGEGLEVVGDLHALREETFNYKWFSLIPPSAEQFDEAWQKAEAKGWRL